MDIQLDGNFPILINPVSLDLVSTLYSSMEPLCRCSFPFATAQVFGQVRCWDQTRKSIKFPLQSWLDPSAKAWFRQDHLPNWHLLFPDLALLLITTTMAQVKSIAQRQSWIMLLSWISGLPWNPVYSLFSTPVAIATMQPLLRPHFSFDFPFNQNTKNFTLFP